MSGLIPVRGQLVDQQPAGLVHPDHLQDSAMPPELEDDAVQRRDRARVPEVGMREIEDHTAGRMDVVEAVHQLHGGREEDLALHVVSA